MFGDKTMVLKQHLYHLLVVGILGLASKFVFDTTVYGLLFGYGVLFGREVSQVEYRAISRGKTWNTLTFRDYIDLENWKSRKGGLLDTVLDLFVPLVFAVVIYFGLK